MFKIKSKLISLFITSIALTLSSQSFAVGFFAGNQFGWRNVGNVASDDDQGAVLRMYGGALWSIDFNNQYVSDTKVGFELAGVSGFNARVSVPPSTTTGTRFMPLNLNFSESIDFLAKAKTKINAINHNLFLAAGGNYSVMKPLNAVVTADSVDRTVIKVLAGLEHPLNKNWSFNITLHHLFNNYDGAPNAQTVSPFKLSGFVSQTMLTLGVEYTTPFA